MSNVTKDQQCKVRTLLIDPPYELSLTSKYRIRKHRALDLPYDTMSFEELKKLPIQEYAEIGCHLWLWTTNQNLKQAFDLMESWGFTYLNIITWLKPNGMGNWFITTTQHILFGYYQKCQFNKKRYLPTHFKANTPTEHSKKPEISYKLIESISDAPRIEFFARRIRHGWTTLGNDEKLKVKPLEAF